MYKSKHAHSLSWSCVANAASSCTIHCRRTKHTHQTIILCTNQLSAHDIYQNWL